jgi:hypothetical protein
MKKFTILKNMFVSALLLFLFTNVSFAQSILFEDFEAAAWKGTGYALRTVTDDLGQWTVAGVCVTDDDRDRFHDTQSIRLRGNPGDNCYVQMNFDKPNGIGEASFYYASYSTHNGGKIVLYYSTDGGTSWVEGGSVTATAWGGEMLKASFIINITGNVRVKIARAGNLANSTTVNVDDLELTDFTCENCVATPTFDPAAGNYSEPVDVTISSATADATIRYTLDGSTPDETSTLYVTPVHIEEQTTIKAKAWKAGMEPSSVSTANYAFVEGISTLAELRAKDADKTTVYKYTGQAVVTQIQEFNTVKYIQDATAAIMLFRSDKLDEMAVGDKITNISGTLDNYFGMLQFTPTENCDIINWDNKVPATTITASQLDYNQDNPIQAKVVILKDVYYVQTGNFAKGTYYTIKENNIPYDSVVYTDKYEADYIVTPTPIPTYLTSIKGVINFKGGATFPTRNRIVPLDNGNNVVQKISGINKSVIQLSPNPATNYVNIVTGSSMKLEVYSLVGTLVAVEPLTEGSNIISVSRFPAGVYLMKMTDTQTGQAFMQKLVVQ